VVEILRDAAGTLDFGSADVKGDGKPAPPMMRVGRRSQSSQTVKIPDPPLGLLE
jgi:hypothetical protein